MMKNKKATGLFWVLAIIILMLAVAVILITLNSRLINGLVLGFGGIQCKLSVTFLAQEQSVPRQCKTQIDEIIATQPVQTELIACPFNADDPKKCASEKIASFAARCWDMLGRGRLDPGDFDCAELCMVPGENLDKITPTDFAEVVPTIELPTYAGGKTKFKDVLPLDRIDMEDVSFGKYVRIEYDDAGGGNVEILGKESPLKTPESESTTPGSAIGENIQLGLPVPVDLITSKRVAGEKDKIKIREMERICK